ncbi:hypothetical protein ABT294_50730, partial [Nonomuraea sp. NPDC000554]|uniref:hypothetical protein n=1 Tax=Nonomuraea sp. NPDC000554 TaxID=3154259 RepID=UPI003322A218
MTAARHLATGPGAGAATLRVVRLPAQSAVPVPGGAPRTVDDVLRGRLAEFLSGVRHTDPVTVHAQVRRDPANGVQVTLRLSGRPAAVDGHAARCRDLLAGLVDLDAAAAHAGAAGPGAWRLPGRG